MRGGDPRGKTSARSTKSRFISATLDLDRENNVRSCRGDISRFFSLATSGENMNFFLSSTGLFPRHNLLTIIFSL